MHIAEIRQRIQSNQYEISLHAERERYAEGISISDLEEAISNGEILVDYPDDPRGTSCLLLGYSQNRPIHVICGYSLNSWIRIITVYIPKPPKWIDERTRGEGGKSGA